MTNKKFNLTKGGWLILLCFGIILLSANNSRALTLPYDLNLVYPNISWGGPIANGWYTEYTLHTEDFGPLDAFCVEKVNADSSALYKLVVLPEVLNEVAGIASLYYNGIVTSKAATQIAIWETLWEIGYTGTLLGEVTNILDLDHSNIIDSIYLAQSPRNTGGYPSQDYLVSVPDASIMWLLGPAFIMLGLLGRKKSKEYL